MSPGESLMTASQNHISVCICTFKRPAVLVRSLRALDQQRAEGLFSFAIIVADNDSERSAESSVAEFAATSQVQVRYCVEPEQNIAKVRNRALSHANGEFVAFIDDDEIPAEDWLWRLFTSCRRFDVDGVLGPVEPYFDTAPPEWVTKGKFFDRPTHPSGYQLSWTDCRTGNVLLRRSILTGIKEPFRPQFGTGGEDTDFFHRMTDLGFRFVWCREAAVRELIPPFRCSRSFLVKRALLRGSNFPKYPAERAKNIAKSLIAVPAYALALPILALCGQHLLMKYLVKLCDHAARLLSLSGVAVVNERET